MLLYNINITQELVSFKEAVEYGIGSEGGLYFPQSLPILSQDILLDNHFIRRSLRIMEILIGDAFISEQLDYILNTAFSFPIILKQVDEHIFVLELFHGPTLAFKDFGARFMAQVLLAIIRANNQVEDFTILTATSGDTGAAAAHAFHNVPNIHVRVLYPFQKISVIQEQLFCTLGGNVQTFAVHSDFDACQALIKQCFINKELRHKLRLNSANSINISRVLAQSLYYYEAVAQLDLKFKKKCDIISVPSGNFGNLTSGIMAKKMGLDVKQFIAATNLNDTIPYYLKSGKWNPKATIPTISNAMDVSKPSNWPRIEEMFKQDDIHQTISGISINNEETKKAMRELYHLGYIAEPHTAIAYAGLKRNLRPGQNGIFLATAHPAKFKDIVEEVLDIDLEIPNTIALALNKANLSQVIDNNFETLKQCLLKQCLPKDINTR